MSFGKIIYIYIGIYILEFSFVMQTFFLVCKKERKLECAFLENPFFLKQENILSFICERDPTGNILLFFLFREMLRKQEVIFELDDSFHDGHRLYFGGWVVLTRNMRSNRTYNAELRV